MGFVGEAHKQRPVRLFRKRVDVIFLAARPVLGLAAVFIKCAVSAILDDLRNVVTKLTADVLETGATALIFDTVMK